MQRKARWLTAAMVAGALVLGACGGDDDDAGGDDATTTTAAGGSTTTAGGATTTAAPKEECTADKKGGDLSFGSGVEIRGLDPTQALGTGIAGGTELMALYDTLMVWNTDKQDFEPHIAESLTPNADLTKWTMKLKPNIKFGNGDPLTTADVDFSVKRMKAGQVAASGLANEITDMTITDPLTMTFNLRQPYGSFAYVLSQETGMVMNAKIAGAMAPADFNKNPKGAGAGPFEFSRFAPGEEVALTGKADYWGGPVCIDTLHIKPIPAGAARLDAFNRDELDVIFQSEAKPIADAKAAGVESYSLIGGAGSTLFLNVGRGVHDTADLKVRQAIAAAIDVKLIDQRVNGGVGLPSTGLIHPEQAVYPGLDGPKYDPDTAKKLVTEAKAAGWDGSLTLTCGNTPSATELSITLQAQMQAVGMTITVENLDFQAQSQKVLLEGNYDIACQGISIFDPGELSRLNQFASDSVRNRIGYKSPAMDAAIKELTVAVSQEEVTAALKSIQEVWNKEVPSHNLYASEWFIGWQDDVHGLQFTRDQVVRFDNAYIDS